MPEMDGTQLVREVAQVSPQTAGLLMTGGASKPSDVPDDVLVLRKPFSTKDLIAAVEATVTRSAELSADLRRHSEKTVQLRQQSEQLQSEAVKTVQETSEILNISRQTRKNWSS
jgi:FixJ family two-component response regulator